MNTKIWLCCLLVAAPLSVSAVANPVDNYATGALSAARYDVAIVRLEAVVAEDRSDPSALLNLALAYAHVGRNSESRALYARVLRHDDAVLDTVAGEPVFAHRVARAGLSRPLALTAR